MPRYTVVYEGDPSGVKILAGEAAPGAAVAVMAGDLIAKSPELAGWQPIATAPKDGTDILLWAEAWEWSWGTQVGRFSGGEWHTGEGSVAENDPDFDPEAEVDEDFDPDEDSNTGPTHWHGLPSPPR